MAEQADMEQAVSEALRRGDDARLSELVDANLRDRSPAAAPIDYLRHWLDCLRPLSYATRDDSWGELEKRLSIVLVRLARSARAARVLLVQLQDAGIEPAPDLAELAGLLPGDEPANPA